MSAERPQRGLLDTNILILRRWVHGGELPDEMAISAVTLAELSAGPHEVRSNDEQCAYDERTDAAVGIATLAADADDTVALAQQSVHPAVGENARAVPECARQECPRHRLLDRTPARFVAEDAGELDRAPSEFRGTAFEDRGRRRRQSG